MEFCFWILPVNKTITRLFLLKSNCKCHLINLFIFFRAVFHYIAISCKRPLHVCLWFPPLPITVSYVWNFMTFCRGCWRCCPIQGRVLEYFCSKQGQDFPTLSGTPIPKHGSRTASPRSLVLLSSKLDFTFNPSIHACSICRATHISVYLSLFKRYTSHVIIAFFFSCSPLPILWWMPPCFSWLPKQS